jgi:Domain of Unknown Function with PDB structure (DUF3857)
MSAKRSLAIFLCLFQILQQDRLYAQDRPKIQFGKISPADFNLPSNPIIDSNAHAVILSDVGDIQFVGNNHGSFSCVFKKHTRIKIIDKDVNAIGLGTVLVLLYNNDDNSESEKLSGVTATTYNLENGRVVESKLDKADIFQVRLDKHHSDQKFAMPAVKPGSIIEYSYTFTSPYVYSLPDWEFQSAEYPCFWSELQVEIPENLTYAVVKQGIHKYLIDKADRGAQSYKVSRETEFNEKTPQDTYVTTTTLKHHWGMKDIPALKVENYLTTPENFIDKLEFQVAGTYNGEEANNVSNTWPKAIEEWLGDNSFGLPLQNDNDWLADLMDKITVNTSGQLSQAKAIYYYVASQFTCNNHSNHYLTARLQDVIQKRGGTVGDVNLLLIAMLRKEHIIADPVLLSTSEHGYAFSRYPVEGRLNYVIVQAKIDGKTYYLDAAHRQLGFGQLPDNCYNGYARVISTDSAGLYFSADSLKETKTTMVIMTNGDKGGLEGSYQSTLGPQESYNTRTELAETGEKKYFSAVQAEFGDDLEISNTGIDSVDRKEDPLNVHYDFRIKQDAGALVYYFTPLLTEVYLKNPFQAAERNYPVEMPYVIDNSYLLNMEIPTGYRVEEVPKSVKVALNGNQGSFEYLIAADASNIQLRVRVKLNRARFLPGDYNNLRDFFAYIVKKESEQIVLKKK